MKIAIYPGTFDPITYGHIDVIKKSLMKVNSVYGLLLAVQSGVGLAALPDYIAHNKNGISKVLPNEPGKPTETHFVYPSSLKNNARLIAFRNFIFSKVNEWKFWIF